MKEEDHGQEATQDARQQERSQEPEAQPIATDVDVSAYEVQIVKRDERIKVLEAQVADAAKTAETAEQLKGQTDNFSAANTNRGNLVPERFSHNQKDCGKNPAKYALISGLTA